jgi:hypothetical protein
MSKTKDYLFPVKKTRSDLNKETLTKALAKPRIAVPVQPIGPIQGIMPQSHEEYWTAQWLQAHHYQFTYQYQVYRAGAPYGVKGDYVVDFLINTKPLVTMLELYGGHWHTGELGQDDRLRQMEIEDQMQDIAKVPMTIIWPPDMINQTALNAALGRALHYG